MFINVRGKKRNGIIQNYQFNFTRQPPVFLPRRPDAIKFKAFDRNGTITDERTTYSIGGGNFKTMKHNRKPNRYTDIKGCRI